MYRIIYTTLLIGLLAVCGCKEEKQMPLFDEDAAPAVPQNVQVENTPGGAKIVFTLPKDPNLLYVRVDYETQGIKRNAIASYYTNYVMLEGYADTLQHEVSLYSMSRSERASQTVKVTIQPKTPAITTAFRSLRIKEDFGGARVWYTNPDTANISIVIMHKDSTGYWVKDEVLYTKLKEGNFAARRLPSRPTDFGVYIKDRWGNYSDTMQVQLTPIFERELDKSKWRAHLLASDNKTFYNAGGVNMRLEKMWDGLWAIDSHAFQTNTGTGVPTTFTFDMNDVSMLSRLRYNQRTDHPVVIWGHGNPREFEIYGRADTPTDSWDGWILLTKVTSVKPSGLPVGQHTEEDLALAQKGEEFDFPIGLPPVRYIRIKVTDTWNKQSFAHIAELTLWGQ